MVILLKMDIQLKEFIHRSWNVGWIFVILLERHTDGTLVLEIWYLTLLNGM
jgi:hypothetical protein